MHKEDDRLEESKKTAEPYNPDDDPGRVTFKEFWALCMAQYAVVLPQLAIMIIAILAAYALFGFWFLW